MSFEPIFERGDDWTLLLLHGTGGVQSDLLELGRVVAPSATLLSPLGQVREGETTRWFRRFSEGVFDEEDVIIRANELADWLRIFCNENQLDEKKVVAMGYSNGANIASAVIFCRPETLIGAILLRPQISLYNPPTVNLEEKSILMLRGGADAIVPDNETDLLRIALQQRGAHVEEVVQNAGHNLVRGDMAVAARWFAEITIPTS